MSEGNIYSFILAWDGGTDEPEHYAVTGVVARVGAEIAIGDWSCGSKVAGVRRGAAVVGLPIRGIVRNHGCRDLGGVGYYLYHVLLHDNLA